VTLYGFLTRTATKNQKPTFRDISVCRNAISYLKYLPLKLLQAY